MTEDRMVNPDARDVSAGTSVEECMSEEFRTYRDKTLLPFIREHKKDVWVTGRDQLKLHGVVLKHPEEKAADVMVHGFCEFFGKFHETAMRFYSAGYSVYFLELRGHGFSEGEEFRYKGSVSEGRPVTLRNFGSYIDDVSCFMEQCVKKDSGHRRYFLFGHSMGRAVCAGYLEEHPGDFSAAVLSSPMLKMNYGKVPPAAVSLLSLWSAAARLDDRYAPGQHAFSRTPDYIHANCDDADRYYYQFSQRLSNEAFETWGGTYAWVRSSRSGSRKALRRAGKIQIPVMVMQAGRDGAVRNEGEESFVRKCPSARLMRYPSSKHELYNARTDVREKYFRDVLSFFRENEE